MVLVEFKHVEKYYGDYHALRDINLRFEKIKSLSCLDLLALVSLLLSVRLMVWRLLTKEVS
ncbi:glutamine ABC transporter ATP-binding protein [Streptococcus pneumoniae]|nr:glutamine ABC transporter ATP-binding protein [Streptococcus pneumoniae]VKV41572.1 glutamine ABC transporter ATP-binding protein [Streptococcus pneumoniae]VRO51602.1 glutamine ABC transporter ATP-binding protein [Streptococcus pneumoniae]